MGSLRTCNLRTCNETTTKRFVCDVLFGFVTYRESLNSSGPFSTYYRTFRNYDVCKTFC